MTETNENLETFYEKILTGDFKESQKFIKIIQNVNQEQNEYFKNAHPDIFHYFYEHALKEQPYAQNIVGMMFLDGYVVKVNYDEAFKWISRSAQQGNHFAQSNVAHLYERGYGVEINKDKMLEFYEKSAEQGNNVAMNSLGMNYYNIKDYKNSYKWYKKAIDNGNETSRENIKKLFQTPEFGEIIFEELMKLETKLQIIEKNNPEDWNVIDKKE